MSEALPPPEVHLIAIGAELLSGDRLETNAHEMQRMLLDVGFVTSRDVVVGDKVDEIAAVVNSAVVGKSRLTQPRRLPSAGKARNSHFVTNDGYS